MIPSGEATCSICGVTNRAVRQLEGIVLACGKGPCQAEALKRVKALTG